jgi:ABC-2 type transport system ATP-binding protein
MHTEQRDQKTCPEPAADVLAQLRGVYKRFGHIEALRGVDLTIHQGEVVALLGPNGAGKTTTISILLGMRRPDRGEAWLFGHPPHLPHSRRNVGATPQETGFPGALTVTEVVELVRTHFPQPLPTAAVLERFGLLDLAQRQTGGLSGGERRRLAVALAFAGNPGAVFLDEPTTGLDVEVRHAVWTAIRSYVRDGGTVLLTTHNMDGAEALASRVVVLDHGQILAEGSVEAIKARVQLTRVRFHAEGLPPLPGIVQSEEENHVYTLYTTDADALVRDLVQQGVAFAGLEVRLVTLEEAFLNLTRGVV